MLTGSCFCGACRFELQRQPRVVAHCHCSICRRLHGAAFGSFAELPHKYFGWAAGSAAPRVFRTRALLRHFCGECGTHLMHCLPEAPRVAGVTLSCIDQELDTKPMGHVYAASKAAWHTIADDGLPRFDAMPPGYTPP